MNKLPMRSILNTKILDAFEIEVHVRIEKIVSGISLTNISK